MNVLETISSAPLDRPDLLIERDEAKLFEKPGEQPMRMLTADFSPLAVYSFPNRFEPIEFSRPKGVFEGPALRLEWQMMSGRQPFYHRNADVDEISFQIDGNRTLMTDRGILDFAPGQFARIPTGVGHDNHCHADIHLLFYLQGPAEPCLTPVALSEARLSPFPGWTPKPCVEMMSNDKGAPNSDIAYSMIDEALLLAGVARTEERIAALQPDGEPGILQWVYKAPQIWIGHQLIERTTERSYTRRCSADDIQYQVEGTRTIISQRGVVTLSAGDFTCIPLGCAWTSVTDGLSKHLSVLTTVPTPPVREPTRLADMDVAAFLRTLPG